ncbi:MAG: hypothetical protein A2Z18_10040 [Armatimonadetes bacterium RBG_16_58_9]|nr:MAG: hypothetical protein A2Z18_10040 [Armatimonadetes bacterium RBG_16_58_9]
MYLWRRKWTLLPVIFGTFMILPGVGQADVPADGSGSTVSETADGSTRQPDAPATEEPAATEPEKPQSRPRQKKPPFFEVHGFLQNNSSQRIVTSSQFPAELLKLENRAQLELIHAGTKWGWHSKTDFIWDPDNRYSRVDSREAYLTSRSSRLDLSLGQQIITWGVGDLLFLTDVFPKDWVAFITGAPIEYLKKGSIAAKADYYVGGTTIEGIWIPVFEPDTLPSGNKLAFFSPFPPGTPVQKVDPPTTFGNSQFGLRASRMIRDYDTSFYLYSGWDPRPSPNLTSSTLEHHHLLMPGLSFQGPFRGTLLSGEFAYYQTEDSPGTNLAIPNPSLRWLLGLERTLPGNRVVSFQFFQEFMTNYGAYIASLPPGSPRQPRLDTILTVRYRDTLRGETVKRTIFALYGPSERDYFINAEWRQDLTDTVWYALGVNLFGGRAWTTYGQFEKDSNLYVTVRRGF